VRVVAAEAIALLGEREAAAQTIADVLKNGNQFEVIAAQNAIDFMWNAIDFMWKAGTTTLAKAQSLVRDLQLTEPADHVPRYLLSPP
jgi:N-sulfoglucosamine sulfohydrolase